jgi:hypothetical protein
MAKSHKPPFLKGVITRARTTIIPGLATDRTDNDIWKSSVKVSGTDHHSRSRLHTRLISKGNV